MIPFVKARDQKAAGPSSKPLQPPTKAGQPGSVFCLASRLSFWQRRGVLHQQHRERRAQVRVAPFQCRKSQDALALHPLAQAARALRSCQRTRPPRSARRPRRRQNWSQQRADETLGSRQKALSIAALTLSSLFFTAACAGTWRPSRPSCAGWARTSAFLHWLHDAACFAKESPCGENKWGEGCRKAIAFPVSRILFTTYVGKQVYQSRKIGGS